MLVNESTAAAEDGSGTTRPRLLAPETQGPLVARPRPTISVIMPYYRGADVIAEAVESVLDQTLPPDEIVICDDGSPDDLHVALGSLSRKVTIVRKANGGPASAMNEAARRANGEYVLQLDQDDAFLRTRVEAVSDAVVARPDADIVATDAIVEYGDEPIRRYSAANPFESNEQRVEILRRCFFAWPAIRRSRLLEVGGFSEAFFHAYDWECFIRLILGGAVVACVDEPLYRWRLSPGSITSSGAQNAEEEIRLLEGILESQALTAAERAAAEEAMFSTRQRALLLEAKEAVTDGRPDARRRSLAVVTGPGFPWRTRLKAAVAAVWPGLVRGPMVGRFGEGSIQRRFGAH
jgi:Glycosyl transferase family 2